ncbi:MAG: tetratricopeptide repeat protein [Roseiflexus sp.]
MTISHEALRQGIAAARSGQRALARQLFARAIQEDRYNDEAWVWLAGVVDEPSQMRQCLQQALRINPLNPQARQGIAWLDQQAKQAAQSPVSNGKTGETSRDTPSNDQVADRNTLTTPEHTSSAHSDAKEEKSPPAETPPASVTSAPEPNVSAEAAPARRFRWFGKPKPATHTPPVSQKSASAQPTDQPRRRFALFGKSEPKPDAAPSPQTSEPTRPVDQPRRRFALFSKPEPKPDAAPSPQISEPTGPVDQPRRRFTLFSKPKPATTPIVAAAGAGAAGGTIAAPGTIPDSKPRRKVKELPPEDGDPIRDRCPYCGELNKPDRAWCRRCDRSLMIRGPVREKRSPWLSILGILWIIDGVLGIAAAVLGLIGILALYSSSGSDLSQFPLIIVLIAVITALIYGGRIAIARAMLNRARWAYWIIAILTTLQLGGSLLGALAAVTIRDAITQAQAFLPWPEIAAVATTVASVLGTAMWIDVGSKAFFMLLVGLSWRDFYGPKERFVSEVRGATDYELFNTALALQRKGMWWMAMKQWEAAVANSPRDTDYLHALAVAYTKLGEWDKARETIAKAIAVAPNNPTLQQIQERIERTIAAQK